LKGGPKVIREGELSVHLTDASRFGATLLLATGSDKHLHELEGLAENQGLTLTAAGLRRGRKVLAAKTEADIYQALGLQYIERNCARASARLRSPGPARSRRSSRPRTCTASYTPIPTPPTGSTRWQR
jgi:hypothetical protein